MSNAVTNVILKVLRDKNINPDNASLNCMVMYSGGADSLSLAKALLDATKHKIVIHHVVLRNPEARDNFQLDVLEKQLDFLRDNCREFEFIKTAFEMNLSGTHTGIRDMSVAMFLAGTACRALERNFTAIYTGHLIATPMLDFLEGSAVLNALFTNRRVKPLWLYPMRHMSNVTAKQEIYKNIGTEGLNLTVSCRKPCFRDETYQSCLTCHACKARARTINALGWDASLVK